MIPTFNSASALERAACSIDLQTSSPATVVIVDNLSRDNTQAIAQAHGFRLVSVPANRVVARFLGLKESTGSHVLFMDSDQVLEPRCIEALTEVIGVHPNAALVLNEESVGGGRWGTLLRLDDKVGFLLRIGLPRCFPRDALLDFDYSKFAPFRNVLGEDRILLSWLTERSVPVVNAPGASIGHTDPEFGEFFRKQFSYAYWGSHGALAPMYARSIVPTVFQTFKELPTLLESLPPTDILAYFSFLLVRAWFYSLGTAWGRLRPRDAWKFDQLGRLADSRRTRNEPQGLNKDR